MEDRIDHRFTFFCDMTIQEFSDLVERCKGKSMVQTEMMLEREYKEREIGILARTFGCGARTGEVASALYSLSRCGVW